MKKLFLILPIFYSSFSYAAGPLYRHKEPEKQLEFENIYQDLRNIPKTSSSTLPSGSTQYIQNTTTQQSATMNVTSGTFNQQLTVNGQILVSTGALATPQYSKTGDTDTGMLISSPNTINIITNGAVVSSFTATGKVLQPQQTSFLVVLSSSPVNVTGNGTVYVIPFNTEIIDQAGDFDSTTFTFAAPFTGQYLLTVSLEYSGASAVTDGFIRIRTSNRNYYDTFVNTTELQGHFRTSIIADMDANDTAFIDLAVSGGTHVVDILSSDGGGIYTTFSGSLLN